MAKFREIIVKSINVQAGKYTDINDQLQDFLAHEIYLVPKEDGEHDRYVSDKNGVVSKQATGSGTTGDFIPLSGTASDKPVTGTLKFEDQIGLSRVANPFFPDNTVDAIFSDDGFMVVATNTDEQTYIYTKPSYIYMSSITEGVASTLSFDIDGLVSNRDFSGTYTDFAFVQKKYVDQKASSIDLQKVLNNGGNANTDTSQVSIDMVRKTFSIGFMDYADFDYTDYQSGLGHTLYQTSFSHSNSSGSVSLNLYKSNDSITFNTATGTKNSNLELSPNSALTYGDDYSSKFTNRSLVDKGYVDNAISSYIPLDGTKQGKPLNGDIQINPANYETRIFCQQNGYGGEIVFNNTQSVALAATSPAGGFYPQRDSKFEASAGHALMQYKFGDVTWRVRAGDGGIALLAENADGEKNFYLNTTGINTNALTDIDSQNANEWTREVCQHPITGGLGFKKKKANILKSIIQITNGTFEPTFVNLENELGNIVWTRTGVGEYIGELANAFPMDKFWANAHISTGDGGVPFGCRIGRLNDNQVYLSIFRTSEGNPSDIAGNCGFLEINVFN